MNQAAFVYIPALLFVAAFGVVAALFLRAVKTLPDSERAAFIKQRPFSKSYLTIGWLLVPAFFFIKNLWLLVALCVAYIGMAIYEYFINIRDLNAQRLPNAFRITMLRLNIFSTALGVIVPVWLAYISRGF